MEYGTYLMRFMSMIESVMELVVLIECVMELVLPMAREWLLVREGDGYKLDSKVTKKLDSYSKTGFWILK